MILLPGVKTLDVHEWDGHGVGRGFFVSAYDRGFPVEKCCAMTLVFDNKCGV